MSQKLPLGSRTRTFIAKEAAFGVRPVTLYDLFATVNTVDVSGVEPKPLENLDESTYLYDAKPTETGLIDGEVKLESYLRIGRTPMSASAVQATTGHTEALEVTFGGMYSNSGSVGISNTTGSVTMASGQGANFTKGGWVSIPSGSTRIPRMVTNVSGDVVSVYPALPGAITGISGSAIWNCTAFYPTQENYKSLTLGHTLGQTDGYQWLFTGCAPNLDFDFTVNEIAKMSLNLKVASGSMISSQSLSIDEAEDTAHYPMVTKNATTWLFATNTTTAAHYPMTSVKFKNNFMNDFAKELGGVEGKYSTVRTGTRIFAEAEIQLTGLDDQKEVEFLAQQTFFFALVIPRQTPAGMRFLIATMPCSFMANQPKSINSGEQKVTTFTLRSMENTLSVAGSDDLARSPFNLVWL